MPGPPLHLYTFPFPSCLSKSPTKLLHISTFCLEDSSHPIIVLLPVFHVQATPVHPRCSMFLVSLPRLHILSVRLLTFASFLALLTVIGPSNSLNYRCFCITKAAPSSFHHQDSFLSASASTCSFKSLQISIFSPSSISDTIFPNKMKNSSLSLAFAFQFVAHTQISP